MATVQYTKYHFNRPPRLIQKDYEILKEILTENENFNLNPPSYFIGTFKGELIFLGIGIFAGVIAAAEIAEWLTVVASILGVMVGYAFFTSFLPSFSSFFDFLSAKASFYRKLKRDIIKSTNYNEFLTLRNNR